MKLTRKIVRANRQRVIDFLLNSARRKAKSKLDVGNGARCCIGHACYALSDQIPRKRINPGIYNVQNEMLWGYGRSIDTNYAPDELIEALGLWSKYGSRGDNLSIVIGNFTNKSLALLNDDTTLTPQEIGAYLKSVIKGGVDTPWKGLSDYPVR